MDVVEQYRWDVYCDSAADQMGGVDSYCTSKSQSVSGWQSRLLVTVGARYSYCDPVQVVSAEQARSVVSV